MDCLREETVPVSGRSGAPSSVALTKCEGSRVIFPARLLTLERGEGYTNDSLSRPDYPP